MNLNTIKMKKILLLSFVAIFISSCGVMTERTMFTASTDAPVIEVINTIKMETVVDKSQVLTGTAKSTRFLIFTTGPTEFADLPKGGIGEKTKRAAIFQALKGTDFDILINPKFNVVTSKNLLSENITVTVIGYGAKYVIK